MSSFGDYELGETPPMAIFENGRDISCLAIRDVFGLSGNVPYNLQFTTDESDIAMPAKLEFAKQGEPTIKIHQEAFDEFASELFARYPAVSMQDLATIYIGATVIPHIVVSSIDPRDKKAVEALYLHMADTDVLNEELADSLLDIGEYGANIARLAFLRLDEDQILLLNRLRLSAGVLAYHESTASSVRAASREGVDFGGRLAVAFKSELKDLPVQLEAYKRSSNACGVFDDYTIENQFLDRISLVELASAFPMSPQEISVIAKWTIPQT